ncbi:MAG: glycosyl transferase group 1 [Acidobacteriales bacterium]|nr:glycosyl transferase group 1 [Terriglobales bacterium]
MNSRAETKRYLVTRTVTFQETEAWRSDVDIEDEKFYVEIRVLRFPPVLRKFAQLWFEFQFGLRLVRLCGGYEAVAVGRYGLWFPILQRVLCLGKRVVMTDIEWSGVGIGLISRAAAKGSVALCCFTREEIRRYSSLYRIDKSKFHFVPAPYQAKDVFRGEASGNYVFAGGMQARDWKTFMTAVEGLPYECLVFARESLTNVPANVSVRSGTRSEFFEAVTNAACVVVPVLPQTARIVGMHTWVSAMAMGKVVIVTEPLGATDYMENGVEGFHVNYQDPARLRSCIAHVMEDAELRRNVGAAARHRAETSCSPESFRHSVLALLEPTAQN